MDFTTIALSIVVPTYNEAANIGELLLRIEQTLGTAGWEIIFVDDDSPDGTAGVVRELARRDPRVRCVQRIGRRGLASACIEGMLASCGEAIVVMDADLQHDERIVPEMLRHITDEGADLVVATRYALGGTTGDWDGGRRRISRLATALSRMVINDQVTDPMSGFFMLRRAVLELLVHDLSGIGFKILLDILATGKHHTLRVTEVPYTFRNRFQGESKLDQQVAWEFGMLLADKLIGRFVPIHFVAFSLIGGLGVFVHMAVLALLFEGIGTPFTTAHSVAALVAMTGNYTLNNELTFRNRRLRGAAWVKGLVSFILCCSIGIVANVGIATYVFRTNSPWVLAALAGIMVGAVWNYAATSFYTWRK